jgi:hypothetical protein
VRRLKSEVADGKMDKIRPDRESYPVAAVLIGQLPGESAPSHARSE